MGENRLGLTDMMMVAFSKRPPEERVLELAPKGEKSLKEMEPRIDSSWDNGPVISLLENWPTCWGDAGEGQESVLGMLHLTPRTTLFLGIRKV